MNKQHITDEIKRTAAENGGVPLGTDRFADVTRIAEAAWRGRFWARCSDAVREAGLTPEDLELIHAISTDDAHGIEAYWHKRFAEKRRGGEWFELSADDVRVFQRRRFM